MKLSKYIDHTLLKSDATFEEIEQLCKEAMEYDFYSVCVQPHYVSLCKTLLRDTDIKIACVIGFPHGSNKSETKLFESVQAKVDGADELDVVLNVSDVKNGLFDNILREMKVIKKTQLVVKYILETCLLTEEEIEKVCKLAVESQIDFVKTSTGFSKSGATVKDVKLMKSVVGDRVKVKASGGIRDYKTAKKMIDAGAERLGASAGVLILKGASQDE